MLITRDNAKAIVRFIESLPVEPQGLPPQWQADWEQCLSDMRDDAHEDVESVGYDYEELAEEIANTPAKRVMQSLIAENNAGLGT